MWPDTQPQDRIMLHGIEWYLLSDSDIIQDGARRRDRGLTSLSGTDQYSSTVGQAKARFAHVAGYYRKLSLRPATPDPYWLGEWEDVG